MKVAQAKLKEIGPDDMNMEEYKVRSSLYIYKANTLRPSQQFCIITD